MSDAPQSNPTSRTTPSPPNGPTGPTGPLAGVRILDLSAMYTGPFATALLADQGAEVVKIERPGVGDLTRWVGVTIGDTSALFQMANRGKRSVAVDLRADAGREVVLRLAAQADVVVQNFRPGVVERLGIGYDDVRAVNEDAIYVSISGYGSGGPYSNRAAFDQVIQSYTGFAINEADEQGTPRFLNQLPVDKITALLAAEAITAALFARTQGRGGQHVRLSMVDATTTFLWPDCAANEAFLDADGTQDSQLARNLRPARCLDGWVMSQAPTRKTFVAMCRAFGIEGHDDPALATEAGWQASQELAQRLRRSAQEVMAGMTASDVVARLDAAGVPGAELQSLAQLVDDPHAEAIGLFEESTHPVAGRIRQPRHPVQFEGTPARVAPASPGLGEHTDAVLQELGLTDPDRSDGQ